MEVTKANISANPLLPELVGKEAETLYILGNGFDIYHNLKTRYSDFRQWLSDSGDSKKRTFVDDMENTFPLETDQDMLWSNFENALGKYREWIIYDTYHKQNAHRNSHLSDDEMVKDMQRLCEDIPRYMTEWAESISKNAEPLLCLSDKSFYLTFNYTRLLEDIYKISPSQICHIHGKVGSGLVITGHNYERDEKGQYDDDYMQELLKSFNQLLKNTEEQIKKHEYFFNRLKDVTHVVVIGHSLDQIDMDYFKKVARSVAPNVKWHFTRYKKKDRFTVYDFIDNMNGLIKERGTDITLPQKLNKESKEKQ